MTLSFSLESVCVVSWHVFSFIYFHLSPRACAWCLDCHGGLRSLVRWSVLVGTWMFSACAGSRLSRPLRPSISQADLGQHGPLHNSSGLLTGRPTSASSTEPLVLRQANVRKKCAYKHRAISTHTEFRCLIHMYFFYNLFMNVLKCRNFGILYYLRVIFLKIYF